MKTPLRMFALMLVAGTALGSAALASDLRVAPVTVDPLAGARATSLTVINEEQHPLRVQIRVFR